MILQVANWKPTFNMIFLLLHASILDPVAASREKFGGERISMSDAGKALISAP